MADTKLDVACGSQNCTSSTSPGASIVSPIITSLVGVVGNAIALLTVHWTKLERHRTVFFVLVAGLAWADLIGIILTTFPVLMAYSNGYFVGGVNMCNYHAFTMITFGLLTPMIVCAMAMERYVGIRHGYFYMRHFNPPRAKIALLILWLAAILFSALPLFGFGQYGLQYPKTWCFLNIHPQSAVTSAYSVTFAVLNLLLIGTMIVCNIVVQYTLVALRCRKNSMNRPDQFRRTHRSPQQQELEVQMTIVLFAITLVFTICWAPLQIVIIMNLFYEHTTPQDHAGDLLAIRLASINQLVDPWVYILCKKLCFRIPCSWWKCFVPGRVSSSNRAQRELLATSSLRLALQNRPTQSGGENRSPFVLPPHTATTVKLTEENNDLPIDSQDSGTSSYNNPSIAISVPQSESVDQQHQDLIANFDSPEVPIPIFTSSHYIIYRSSRSVVNQMRNHRKFRSSSTRGNRGVFSRTKMFSISNDIGCVERGAVSSSGYRRRSHSWSCTDITYPPKKRYVTKCTQTMEKF